MNAGAGGNQAPKKPEEWEIKAEFFKISHSNVDSLEIEVTREKKGQPPNEESYRRINVTRKINGVSDEIYYTQSKTNGFGINDRKQLYPTGKVFDAFINEFFGYLNLNKNQHIKLLKLVAPEREDFQPFLKNFMDRAEACKISTTVLEVKSGITTEEFWALLEAVKCVRCEKLQITFDGLVPTKKEEKRTLDMIEERLDDSVRTCTIISNEAIPPNLINMANNRKSEKFIVKTTGKTLEFTKILSQPSSSSAGTSSRN